MLLHAPQRRNPLNGRWALTAAFVLALAVGSLVGAHWFGAPHRVTLGGPEGQIVRVRWVQNGSGADKVVDLNTTTPQWGSGAYEAFMETGSKPRVGVRYYARFFDLRTPDGANSPAVALISVVQSRYS